MINLSNNHKNITYCSQKLYSILATWLEFHINKVQYDDAPSVIFTEYNMDWICYTILRCGAIRDNHKCRLIKLDATALFYSFTNIHGNCAQQNVVNASGFQLFTTCGKLLQRKNSVVYSSVFTMYYLYSKYLWCLNTHELFYIRSVLYNNLAIFRISLHSFFQDFRINNRHDSCP